MQCNNNRFFQPQFTRGIAVNSIAAKTGNNTHLLEPNLASDQCYGRTAPTRSEGRKWSRDRPRSQLRILIRRQLTAQITVRRSRHLLLLLRPHHRGSVVGGQKVEFVGRELGLERLLRAVDGEFDDESVRASDVEGAEGGFVVPGDLDAQQFLQVGVLGDGRGLVHVGGVVDGRDVVVVAPVPLLVAFAEHFVADALDVGVGLQLYDAFTQRDDWRGLRCGCFDVVLDFEDERERVG